MATIRLRRIGVEEIVDLPAVCMRCGAEATHVAHSVFMRSLFLRQRVAVPLCQKHRRHHWWLVDMEGPLSLLRWALCFGWVGFIFMSEQIGSVSRRTWLGIAIWMMFFSVTLIWMYFQRRYVRLVKFTDSYIELTNVASEFVDAVEREAWEFYRHARQDSDGPSGPRRDGEQFIQPGGDEYQAE
jgi:hypothetical protein